MIWKDCSLWYFQLLAKFRHSPERSWIVTVSGLGKSGCCSQWVKVWEIKKNKWITIAHFNAIYYNNGKHYFSIWYVIQTVRSDIWSWTFICRRSTGPPASNRNLNALYPITTAERFPFDSADTVERRWQSQLIRADNPERRGSKNLRCGAEGRVFHFHQRSRVKLKGKAKSPAPHKKEVELCRRK